MDTHKNFFCHPTAIVEDGAKIGNSSKIWAFSHVLSGASVGSECNICDHVFIESDVIIGDRVTIKCGTQIWDGIKVENDVFIGPNVTFTNDPFPRSKKYLETYPKTIIEKGASIGGNSTLKPGIRVGQFAMIGAGSVVTKDVPASAIVYGNPARIMGYVNQDQSKILPINLEDFQVDPIKNNIDLSQVGAKLIELTKVSDMRGNLSFTEFGKDLPFKPTRCFWVYNVPTQEVRGEHAHKVCEQFLIAVSGSISVLLDNGNKKCEVLLNQSNLGLYIPPGVWGVQYKYSSDAILVVLASHPYDPNDYIRNYQDFLIYVSR